MAKRKAVNFEIISRAVDSEPHAVLDEMLEFHRELDEANIGLAWRKLLKTDKDGHLVLGKCVKISGLHRELAEYDFVVVLNREMWSEFSLGQRKALMDHELCHAAPDEDEDGLQKRDQKDRRLWRTRKHDIEEFTGIIQRHGCYKRDLERFAKAIQRRQEAPLFESPEDPKVSVSHNGETVFEGRASDLTEAAASLAPATMMGGTHQKGTRGKKTHSGEPVQ